MGYDMYHEHQPPEEVAAYDQASALFREKVRERDSRWPNRPEVETPEYEAAQKAVNDAYEALSRAEAYYFRLNIFGMNRYLDGMEALGMLDLRRGPDNEEWQRIDFDGDEDKAQAEAEMLRTRTAERPTGIPSFKFGSNDGWLVTPEEITAALERYEKPPAGWFEGHDIEEDYWDEWIEFLRKAIERGGFRVY
jgi:hypothetical protein